MSAEGAKRREEARAKYGDQLRATFKKVDKDNSGSATIDEMWWACPTIIRDFIIFWSELRVFILKVPGKKILLFSNFCIEMKKKLVNQNRVECLCWRVSYLDKVIRLAFTNCSCPTHLFRHGRNLTRSTLLTNKNLPTLINQPFI